MKTDDPQGLRSETDQFRAGTVALIMSLEEFGSLVKLKAVV